WCDAQEVAKPRSAVGKITADDVRMCLFASQHLHTGKLADAATRQDRVELCSGEAALTFIRVSTRECDTVWSIVLPLPDPRSRLKGRRGHRLAHRSQQRLDGSVLRSLSLERAKLSLRIARTIAPGA